MNVSKKIKNFFKGGKVETRNTEVWQDSEVVYVGPVNLEPKKVTVKINIDKEGRYFLDKNGMEVEMLDSDENYVKKIKTEEKKVQEIFRRYVMENQ